MQNTKYQKQKVVYLQELQQKKVSGIKIKKMVYLQGLDSYLNQYNIS